MTDLVEFLKARLDDEERAVQRLLTASIHEPQEILHRPVQTWVLDHPTLEAEEAAVRVLADVEAKRELVNRYHAQATLPDGTLIAECTTCGDANEAWPCPTLRVLALPYAAHPEYDARWTL